MREIVLQEKRTLTDAIIGAVKTFPNGCNYRLRKDADGSYWLEYGCYGVLTNLQTGDGALLHSWFVSPGPAESIYNLMHNKKGRRLHQDYCHNAINHLLTIDPCETCGGARFASQESAA